MKLHNYFRSSASFRVRIALELKGLRYEYIPVHIARGDHKKEAYAALSADTLVPLLEVDGEKLSQSMAIIEYLDEKHPAPALLPADAMGRARVRALAQSIACEIHPINNLRVLNTLRHEMTLDDERVDMWVRHWIANGFEALERGAPETGLFGGESPDLADVCLVPQMYNARRFDLPLGAFPRLVRIDAALREIDAFARAAPEAVKSAKA